MKSYLYIQPNLKHFTKCNREKLVLCVFIFSLDGRIIFCFAHGYLVLMSMLAHHQEKKISEKVFFVLEKHYFFQRVYKILKKQRKHIC